MKFLYKRISKDVQRPIIPVTIRNPRSGQSVRYLALVDSGADISIFSTDISDVIGIDLATGIKQTVSGVIEGQSRPYYIHDVEVEIGGNTKLTKVAFMPDLATNGHGLLGQSGFFDRFKFVKFEHLKGTIEIGVAL